MGFQIFLNYADEIVDRTLNMTFWLFNRNRKRKKEYFTSKVRKMTPPQSKRDPSPLKGGALGGDRQGGGGVQASASQKPLRP